MIFRDRRRSARRRACSAAVLAVVFALGGFGVYEGWKRWNARSSDESEPQEVATAPKPRESPPTLKFARSVWSFGDWERWIQPKPEVVVLETLPGGLESSLREQGRLFRNVIAERESAKEQGIAGLFESMRDRFPDGGDVSVGYSSGTTKRHASASHGRATVSGTSYRSGGRGSKGVLVSFLHRYEARIRQLREESAIDQLKDLRDRVERDIADLEARRIREHGPLAAQTKATLSWLRNDVRPYLAMFEEALREARRRPALEAWNAFEEGKKISLERTVDSLTVDRLSLDGREAVVPAGNPLLLDAEVGTRRMVFLPGRGGEISVRMESVESVAAESDPTADGASP